MKKNYAYIAILGALIGTSAMAEDGRYISVAGGMTGAANYDYAANGQKIELDSGTQFSGAVGQSLVNNWRAEIALSLRNQDGKRIGGGPASTNAYAIDLNGYYDFKNKSAFTPYIGAGAGISQYAIDDGILDDNVSTLHLLAVAGASYKLNDKASFFIEGHADRYGTMQVEFTNGLGTKKTEDLSISSTGFQAGVKFAF